MYSIPPFSSGTTDPFHDLDGEPGHGSCTSLGNFLRGRRCSELSQASDCEDPEVRHSDVRNLEQTVT